MAPTGCKLRATEQTAQEGSELLSSSPSCTHTGMKSINPAVTPAQLILSSATSKAHRPQPMKGGTHSQHKTSRKGRKVKCNAFPGIPAVWGCSKQSPSACCTVVEISFKAAQLQKRRLNIEAGSALKQADLRWAPLQALLSLQGQHRQHIPHMLLS